MIESEQNDKYAKRMDIGQSHTKIKHEFIRDDLALKFLMGFKKGKSFDLCLKRMWEVNLIR
jgi:hypothetical protein